MRIASARRSAALAVAALALLTAPARADTCAAPCPYTGVASIGDRTNGELRLPQGVAVDAAGNVFVGDQYTGAIERFAPDGTFQLAFGAPGSSDGRFGALVGLAYDPADNSIYAADAVNDRIQHFADDGTFIGQFGSKGGGPGQFVFQDGSSVDNPAQGGVAVGAGKLWVADSGNDRVQSFPLADVRGKSPTAATGTIIGATRADGSKVIDNPQGLFATPDGRLYVANDLQDVITVFDPQTNPNEPVGSLGLGGPGAAPGQFDGAWDVAVANGFVYAVDDNNGRIEAWPTSSVRPGSTDPPAAVFGTGQLRFPRAMALGPTDGALYITNTAAGRVDKYVPAGANATFAQSFGKDGRAAGQFITPSFLASSPDGGLAVPDTEDHRMEQFKPDNTLLQAYGGRGSQPAQFLRPQGVAVDNAFNAWVVDTDNDRLERNSLFGGTPSVVYGTKGAGDGQLDNPLGAATDAAGDVYVADLHNNRVVEVSPTGQQIRVLTSTHTGPRGVAVSPVDGHVFVTWSTSNRVVEYDPATGSALREFGAGGSGTGQLSAPAGIAADAAGRLYVVDAGNDRVERFTAAGTYEQTIGTEGTDLGQFERPTGVAVACDGRLAVADTSSNRIQRFTLAGSPPTTPCLPTPAVPQPPVPTPPEAPTPAPQPVVTTTAPAPTPVPRAQPRVTLSVRGQALTRALARRRLTLSVLADHTATLTVTAKLGPAKSAKYARTLRAHATLRAAARATITLKLSAADVRALRKALGRSTALRLTLTLRASRAGYQTASVSRSYRASA